MVNIIVIIVLTEYFERNNTEDAPHRVSIIASIFGHLRYCIQQKKTYLSCLFFHWNSKFDLLLISMALKINLAIYLILSYSLLLEN